MLPLIRFFDARRSFALLLSLCLGTCVFASEEPASTPASAVAPKVASSSNLAEVVGVEEIVFAERPFAEDGHYYANFGYYCQEPEKKAYPVGGRLCRMNLRTGKVTALVEDLQGGVRDPQMHYDGKKILFSYRNGGEDQYHLYEINVDGTGLRQLTDGPYDDIEPTYLPDGQIVFCSSRCNRWVMCWKVPVAILYKCDADGKNIKMLSSNAVTENTPSVLPDGRILYTRWEYIERSQLAYHHLWTINPDGSGQMAYYGNMHPTGKHYNLASQTKNLVTYQNVPGDVAMLDAKPIPGTNQVLSIFSPGHGRKEHAGFITVIDPRRGPDDISSARRVHPKPEWRDAYPLSDSKMLVARWEEIHLMDFKGQAQLIHRVTTKTPAGQKMAAHEPIPVRPRPRERLVAERSDLQKLTGQLILTDVTTGRNMKGVKSGEIKRLLVMEQLPGPFHVSPGFDGISQWGSFTLTRILGTVPVESDGSAYFEVPAMRSLIFVALDEKDLAVKKMQSFVTVQPGEVTGCVGCHEERTRTPENPPRSTILALQRPVSLVQPIEGVPAIIDFTRHIQPLLNRHCTECHGPEKADGGLRLSGKEPRFLWKNGPQFSPAYLALLHRLGEIADGRNSHGNRPPRTMGSSASKLIGRFDESHYDVKATAEEKRLVRLWLDSGAVAAGTYAIMDGGTPENPSPNYIREMKRYGLLPPEFDKQKDPLDVYQLDEAYWQTFWYHPEK